MSLKTLTLTLFIAASSLTDIAHGQMASAEYKKEMLARCQKLVDVALRRITPQLDEYPHLKAKRDLALAVPAADFNAFSNDADQQVLIPVMWCVQSWYLVDAIAQMYQSPSLRQSVFEYIKYLNERQAESIRIGPVDNTVLLPFNSYAKVPRKALSHEDERRYATIGEGMLLDAITFVLGHEIGHLALKHKRYNTISAAQSRRQENQADSFAVSMLVGADVSVFPSMMTIVRFLESEAALKGSPSASRTHPRAECRLERIIASTGELNEALQNPERRREFEQGSGYTVSQYRGLMRDLRHDCRLNP